MSKNKALCVLMAALLAIVLVPAAGIAGNPAEPMGLDGQASDVLRAADDSPEAASDDAPSASQNDLAGGGCLPAERCD